ncbi:MAG: hypothetical protein HQ564_05765 [Candidatus Saganbacteria bacterium]|nr:hypothetical protein [Candidatus Saganbacteria bacterium]
MKLLIISNGHGEDLVGAKLAEEPATKRRGSIIALPLVGEGKAYKCKVLGPRKKLPSGGFSLRNLSYLWKDIANGLFGQIGQFYKILTNEKPDLVIAIGDIVPIICAKITKAPFIFIGVNKTDYYEWFGYSYTPWEIWLLKSAKKVYTRDQLTADNLKLKSIRAEFVGNPLMDTLSPITYNLSPKTIGLLPGTRDSDIDQNINDFIRISKEIKKLDDKIEFVMALKEPRVLTSGVPSPFIVKPFEEVLAESSVILGLSGTGNEQAAGLGIPVISFPGQGSQYTKKFGEAQTQLLGKALAFIPERNFQKISNKCLEIIGDPRLRENMGKSGKERMGKPGAIETIAKNIS